MVDVETLRKNAVGVRPIVTTHLKRVGVENHNDLLSLDGNHPNWHNWLMNHNIPEVHLVDVKKLLVEAKKHHHSPNSPAPPPVTKPVTNQIISFYNKREPYYEFTNFWDEPIDVDRFIWSTSEHYFQAGKFPAQSEPWEHVRRAVSASEAFQIARYYDNCKSKTWENDKDARMKCALYAKFTQHRYLWELLLSTYPAHLVEASPKDAYWGYGEDKKGLNKLGKYLVEIRGELHNQYRSGVAPCDRPRYDTPSNYNLTLEMVQKGRTGPSNSGFARRIVEDQGSSTGVRARSGVDSGAAPTVVSGAAPTVVSGGNNGSGATRVRWAMWMSGGFKAFSPEECKLLEDAVRSGQTAVYLPGHPIQVNVGRLVMGDIPVRRMDNILWAYGNSKTAFSLQDNSMLDKAFWNGMGSCQLGSGTVDFRSMKLTKPSGERVNVYR